MKQLVFGVLIGIASAAIAVDLDTSLIQTTGTPSVESGKFYGYRTATTGPGDAAFQNAKALAESEGVPLVVIWSHESCHFCANFITSLNANKSGVLEWLGEKRAVFTFFKATGYNDTVHDDSTADAGLGITSPKACLDAWQFAAGTCGAKSCWPLVGFYYSDGTRTVKWGSPLSCDGNGDPIYTKDFAWLKESFADWCREAGLDYAGGDFAVVPDGLHRYEAEESTASVPVELRRENLTGTVATNVLTACWSGAAEPAFTTNLVWAAGQSEMTVPVPARPDGMTPFAPGTIALSLYDAGNGLRGTNVIVCVEKENGASNPKWIGEAVDFGEWTMDLDAATNLAATAGGYTLVSMQGSLWCPDCANVDRNFLELEDGGENLVKQWARARKVALVSIDIPNFNGPTYTNFASPTLVSRSPYASALVRQKELPMSGGDPDGVNRIMRSGLGYQSRKGIDEAAALAVLERNHFLAVTNTDKGGFHRPDDSNANRTGVPIFVLLDSKGRVSSRLTRMASVSPMKYDADSNVIAYANATNILKRFDEMLAIATDGNPHSDETEIGNGYIGEGAIPLNANGGTASNELCHADFQDVFLLDGAGGGTRQNIVVSGTSDAKVKVSFATVNPSNGKMKTLLSTNAVLSAGTSLSMDFADDGEYYAVVAGSSITDAEFDLYSPEDSHFHPYTIRAAAVLIPSEKKATASAPAGTSEVVMHVDSGTLYRITGITGGIAGRLTAVDTDLYRAEVTDDLRLTTSAVGGAVGFQIWNPGEIGFETSVERVLEYAPTGIVAIVRRNGSSGAASVRVSRSGADPAAAGRYVWHYQTVSWADGESGVREVGFAPVANGKSEGEASFYLVLAPVGDCPAEVSSATNTVTIYDTDTPCLEKTEYTVDTYGNFSSELSMKVLNLREGGRVTLTATRGLPSGMKLAYDQKTGSVVLSGVPTKPGTYEIELTVSECRRSGKSTGEATTIVINVADAADYNGLVKVKRPAQKLALMADADGLGRLAGFLDLSITAKGRISAKYSGTETKAISFSGNWSGFLADGSTVETTLESKGAELHLEMDCFGTVYAGLSLPDGYSRYTPVPGFTAVADWPEETDCTPFKGYYTVELPVTNSTGSAAAPSGAGFLTLAMTSSSCVKSGTVRYAGVLPDGTSVSGSTTMRNFTGFGDGAAEVPVFNRIGKNVFGVVMSVSGNGADRWNDMLDVNRHMVVLPADGTQGYVLHSEAGFGYDLWLDAHGSYYVQGIAPSALRGLFYDKFAEDVPYVLSFGVTGAADSERHGAVVPMSGAEVWPLANRMAMDRQRGLSFSFSARSGTMSGSAGIVFADGRTVSGTYRGAVVPGWVDAESCCGAASYDGPVLPFGRGTFYFRDVVGGRSVMRSLPVVLDIRR